MPVVQRLWVRHTRTGRLRFASHRDLARTLERALRRARVPMAYSQGFSPHPKISYAGAAPTGAASEAEYLELGLGEERDPEAVLASLNAALPEGMQLNGVAVAGSGPLAARIDASRWQLRLDGAATEEVAGAVAAFVAAESVPIERVMKDGPRTLDARSPVVSLASTRLLDDNCVILDLVVRHVIPAVRPDDVLAALRELADLAPPSPPMATRLAQGLLTDDGRLADPLHSGAVTAADQA
ncbi:MAG: TIGR03936 family radical SAM-associated protein [Actinomycetes bacterium]